MNCYKFRVEYANNSTQASSVIQNNVARTMWQCPGTRAISNMSMSNMTGAKGDCA